MKQLSRYAALLAMAFLLLGGSVPAMAQILVQCPGDLNGDSIPDPFLLLPNGKPSNKPNPEYDPGVKCMHLSAGDGYISMADGRSMYMFGFGDVTGIPEDRVMEEGMMSAAFPAPTIVLDEGDRFYLNLTNVGMMMRPDLFDPHTVHWHGFPQASSVFDGVPDASISINMGATLTYFYHVVEPGTYMYHCHVEATEHMQMGMLGNLYVRPAQNRLPAGQDLNGFIHQAGYTYAYNDGDGSTYYDVEYPIQIGSFDSAFHDASESVNPLPFALMRDDYPMLNGRGYPDTIVPGSLTPPMENMGRVSQPVSSLIEASQGQKILLRVSNLNVTRFYTLASLGIPMKVVGYNARLLRGPSPDGITPGKDLYYTTHSVTLGGGEALDVILDTADVDPGTYFLYTTNLNYLSNDDDPFGGMMTEIRIQ
ncbi:multicopper oxidase domain-containing protein [Desulfatiglans anilini]|uniref:multicopper oxidase domain-containing protein n=1 Tax=Desulfatiglans anilini TaxID=90728 RepID=UPI00041F3645|nr:multicopper oxidase domain-containing protein [Desulfatiglans anilini]